MLGGADAIDVRLILAWRNLAARERWLLGLLAVVALSLALVSAADWSGRQREANALARADQQARQEGVRRARARPAAADASLMRTLADGAFKGADIWMARVAVEEYLFTTAVDAGVAEPRIHVAETTEGDPDWPVLKAEISAPYEGAAMTRLLQRLAADGHFFFIDSLSADHGESPEFRLLLSFPVELGVRAPGG